MNIFGPSFTLLVFAFLITAPPVCTAADSQPKVSAPPDSFFDLVREQHRDKARGFYRKHLDISGLSVAAAGEVDDRALHRTQEIVSRMLAGRPTSNRP